MDLAMFRYWLAVLMLVDSGFALLFGPRLRRAAGGFNVERVAIWEASAALIILYIHFLVDPR